MCPYLIGEGLCAADVHASVYKKVIFSKNIPPPSLKLYTNRSMPNWSNALGHADFLYWMWLH